MHACDAPAPGSVAATCERRFRRCTTAPCARRAAGRDGAARCGAGCLRDAQVGLARAAGAWAGLKHVGPEKAAKLAIPTTPVN